MRGFRCALPHCETGGRTFCLIQLRQKVRPPVSSVGTMSSQMGMLSNPTTEQSVEVGIAAGLASCGKKPFAASPASFLTTRSYEQCKVDCAYSDTNVTLIGISGGVSYGALGMSHHSTQDLAATSAIPNMRVYVPSDRFQTAELIKALLKDDKCA